MTSTSVCRPPGPSGAPPIAPCAERISIAAHTPTAPTCVIPTYTITARRTSSSWRATSIAAAGISVISSQHTRNDVMSRAATSPAMASTNAAVSAARTADLRPGGSASRAYTTAGSATTHSTSRKNPLSASKPKAGCTPLRNPAPTGPPPANTATAPMAITNAPTACNASDAR